MMVDEPQGGHYGGVIIGSEVRTFGVQLLTASGMLSEPKEAVARVQSSPKYVASVQKETTIPVNAETPCLICTGRRFAKRVEILVGQGIVPKIVGQGVVIEKQNHLPAKNGRQISVVNYGCARNRAKDQDMNQEAALIAMMRAGAQVRTHSGLVQPGDIFVAVAGSRVHGARYCDDAVLRGAKGHYCIGRRGLYAPCGCAVRGIFVAHPAGGTFGAHSGGTEHALPQ